MNLAGSAPRAALLTNGYYETAAFALSSAAECAPTNPRACGSGLTIALWARVEVPPAVGGASVVLFSSGPPTYTGISLQLMAGSYATSASTAPRVKLVAIVKTGERTWSASAEYDADLLIGVWRNYAVSWAPDFGIFIIVDGLIGGALVAHCCITESVRAFDEHRLLYPILIITRQISVRYENSFAYNNPRISLYCSLSAILVD